MLVILNNACFHHTKILEPWLIRCKGRIVRDAGMGYVIGYPYRKCRFGQFFLSSSSTPLAMAGVNYLDERS
jgi:hypothetical protein